MVDSIHAEMKVCSVLICHSEKHRGEETHCGREGYNYIKRNSRKSYTIKQAAYFRSRYVHCGSASYWVCCSYLSHSDLEGTQWVSPPVISLQAGVTAVQRELPFPNKRVAACKTTWSDSVSVFWHTLLSKVTNSSLTDNSCDLQNYRI